MLRWLTRLFRPQRTDAERAVAAAAPAPEPAVIALPQLDPPAAPPVEEEEEEKVAVAVAPAAALEARETCPDCGRTSVFAGPPGDRYCMHCALRRELFDSKTASN